ncbi:sugar phosphate isomerase/epimerase family protein [Paenibacillus tianjinensis]|uniref:Sugar phosphate isomerase/epimerase n=1 Tax=Paenibacillus tianjinensis TaxID=2810347 RepID=A0ABX7LGR7_9BACL|nr:sugar phosphate isomerase/epimerase family protein [Paenibacillus tianjinensis]QSF46174.1 sugar phosphate isomerase/epimerase [Paenibacillus tianjinensis]
MRIGVDGKYLPGGHNLSPVEKLEYAHSLGLEGVFFRTILHISPNLNGAEIQAVQRKAQELGMYLEAGLGRVNPYTNPETPELRAIGNGDVLLGFRRMMEAAAEADIRELWVSTGGAKPYKGMFATDRFRTDVTWEEQLEATERLLLKLKPLALDLGLHLNMETHEEITSYEIVRLIEAVGADVMGVVFDTANVMIRGEHPVLAARRLAPYVRQTHIKDAYLELTDGGVYQRAMPCEGEGAVDFSEVLKELNRYNPELTLSFEAQVPHGGRMPGEPMVIEVYDPQWIQGHPDLTREDFAAYYELARNYSERIRSGQAKGWQALNAERFEEEEAVQAVIASRRYLDGLCRELGIQREQAPSHV